MAHPMLSILDEWYFYVIMERIDYRVSKKDSSEVLPPLFHYMISNAVAGFDNVDCSGDSNHLYQPTSTVPTVPSPNLDSAKGAEAAASENSLVQAIDLHQLHSISISMPSSPAMLPLDQYKRVLFSDANNGTRNLPANSSNSNTNQPKQPSEDLLLPDDRNWPFLLRFPISSFGICLGVSSQPILWKALATSLSMGFLHITPTINVVLWCFSVAVTAIVTLIYSLKLFFYFEAVRREYHHPIRVNFFFAPWIALLFLALGVPPLLAKNLHVALWYVLMAPIICLDLKIYGQWMSGGQRRLLKVANPLNFLSIVGNFVGALLGSSMGLKEGPIFFFAVGLAHYIVLFVTLYQRLPTNETLPKELHPVFFLFIALPSVASMAWAMIQGDFDYGSRIAYFIALFLYFSLAVRISFFRGFRFSLAWWAYTFPMTGVSIATIKYSNEVQNPLTQALSITLSSISTLTVTALLVSTVVHAFVLRDLFPNDIAIAIADRRSIGNNKHSYLQSESSDAKDGDNSVEMNIQGV